MVSLPPSTCLGTTSRRALVRILAGGLAVLAGTGATTGTAKRRRRKKPKFRTVTKTFTNAAPIPLQDVGPADLYPSPIQVSGFKQGEVLDVNVTLKRLTHEFPPVIDMLLVAPNGRRAVIMSDAGGNQFPGDEVTDITFTLDDQAAAPLPPFSPLASGRFKPTNLGEGLEEFFPPAPSGTTTNVKLATFAGINPNGLWRLFVADIAFFGFTGSFAGGWSLSIKARVRR